MRLLEFAIELTEHNYNIILIDSSDISSITKIDNHTCQLLTKSNQTYKVIGTYRNLTNRFINYLESLILLNVMQANQTQKKKRL